MRITTKGRYAIKAITNLAITAMNKPKSIKAIAQDEEISAEFLEQIFFKLKKAGIIDSTRGPGGGFKLNGDPNTITVKDIFIAVDEGLDLTPCTTCNEKDGGLCERTDICIVHDVWKDASTQINDYFHNITLQTIMDSTKGKALADRLRNPSSGSSEH